MNRSYSKIRHIQESNLILEQRKFKKLLKSTLGDVRPLLYEGDGDPVTGQKPSPSTTTGQQSSGQMNPVTPNPNVKVGSGKQQTPQTDQTGVIPLAVYESQADADSKINRYTNIDVMKKTLSLKGASVYFTFNYAGKPNQQEGVFRCDTQQINLNPNTAGAGMLYITKTYHAEFQKFCDAYASNRSQMDNRMA